MVKTLDRRPEARRPYRRLYDRAARADEPGIHGRPGARVSFGRREFLSGAADLRHEAAWHGRSSSLAGGGRPGTHFGSHAVNRHLRTPEDEVAPPDARCHLRPEGVNTQ